MTRASLALVAAIAGAVMLSTGSSDAAPLGLGKSALVQSESVDDHVILVRDGCGRGMRWSHRRQACVEDFRGGPPAVVVVPNCRPGWRWSNGRQACVPAGGGVDPAAAIIGGVIGGVISGATRPRGCGPGMRWSDRRGGCVPR
jgi:hypothetical protein